MKELTGKLLKKADRAIRAAEVLVRERDPDSAAGRAYYAMFYTAEALLGEQGLKFRKHGGVHSAFGEHFVKNNWGQSKYYAVDRPASLDKFTLTPCRPVLAGRNVPDNEAIELMVNIPI